MIGQMLLGHKIFIVCVGVAATVIGAIFNKIMTFISGRHQKHQKYAKVDYGKQYSEMEFVGIFYDVWIQKLSPFYNFWSQKNIMQCFQYLNNADAIDFSLASPPLQ